MTNQIDISKAYMPEKKMAYRNIGGKIVLVDTSENRIITLNDTASFIWEALDGRTVETIINEMMDEFEVEEKNLLDDILEFLDEISKRGFIREVRAI